MSEHERLDGPTARTVIELSEAVAGALSEARRRHVLSALAAGEGRHSFEDLASAVAAEAREFGTDGSVGSRKRIETWLYHCDLPKLAGLGLVEYDRDCGDAALTDEGAECAAALGLG